MKVQMTQKAVCSAGKAGDNDSNVQEAVDTYLSSLSDLTVNSKPHINSLTMLAEDYYNYAEAIVSAVDTHLKQVSSNVKLPVLYLIDSIVKNVGRNYVTLFSRIIVSAFCSVFEVVDEKTRANMYKLRQTWNHIYSTEELYAMDVRVHNIDPNWPITAEKPAASRKIHVNPRFLQTTGGTKPPAVVVAAAITGGITPGPAAPVTPATPTPPVVVPAPAVAAAPVAAARVARVAAAPVAAAPVAAAPVAAAPVAAAPVAAARVAAAPKTVAQRRPDDSLTGDVPGSPSDMTASEAELREELLRKKRGLLKLEQEKVNLQLSQMKARLDKKQRQMSKLSEKASQKGVPTSEKTSASQSTPSPTHQPAKADITITAVTDPRATTNMKPAATATSATPRIAPVSCALVNLVANQRTQRDPRLSAKQVSEVVATPVEEVAITRVSRDPRIGSKVDSRSKSGGAEEERVSKKSSREASPSRSSRHSSRRETKEKRTSDRKAGRKSEERASPRSKKSTNHSPSKSHKRDRRRNRSHSRDRSRERSREKSRDFSRDRSRSPRVVRVLSRVVSDCADSQLEAESGAEDSKNQSGSPSHPSSTEWPVNYTKGSRKGRNYRNHLESPEPAADVDLRVCAAPEKQSRLAAKDASSLPLVSSGVPEQILPTLACQDVDLRCLPSSPGQKRQSAEPEDALPPKKNKAAYLEMLFGKQDVDLRQLNPAKVSRSNGVLQDTPSPPPPPIISLDTPEAPPPPHLSPREIEAVGAADRGWSKYKQLHSPSVNLDRSPFTRPVRRGFSSHRSENERHQSEDTDMRSLVNGHDVPKPNFQAILAGASEQLKNGTMSRSDFEKVQQQVFCMQESEKLKEAQRNDYSRRETWERRPQRERDYRHGLAMPPKEHFGDVDERFGPTTVESQPKVPLSRPGKKPLLPLPPIPPRPLQDDVGGSHRPHSGPRGPGMSASMRPAGPLLAHPPRGLLRPPHWRSRMGPGRVDNTIPIPTADPHILDKIAQDPMKAIVIDGVCRDIRFYGDDAVAFLSRNDPCEIAFEHGEAKVVIDDTVMVTCAFREPAKEIELDGKIHRVRLGAPSRELYIDDQWYEVQFNQPPVEIILNSGMTHLVQLQGEMPKVHIGQQRKDLVAGCILMVIDAKHFIPIYLDAKPQRFDIEGVPHILRFMDALRTILVNGHKFNIEFGGSPVPITVNNARHYIRLTELPPGVVPGEVDIVSMAGVRGKAPAPSTGLAPGSSLLPAPRPMAAQGSAADAEHEPVLPMRGRARKMKPKLRQEDSEHRMDVDSGDRKMPADLLSAIQPGLPSLYATWPTSSGPGYGISSAGSSVKAAAQPPAPVVSESQTGAPTSVPTTAPANGLSVVAPELNMDELFQRLLASGIVSSLSTVTDTKKTDSDKEKEKTVINVVDFTEPQTLKVKQPGIVNILYSGIQCSSCGTRFPPEQTVKYSQHLDWHFRQNRRDRDSARKPQSRKWYYDVADWIQFEEIEDLEERAQSWFETQQGETSKVEEPEPEEIQSVPTSDFPDEVRCELCHDKFEQFYNEEKEEWHFKHCVVMDNHTYHPLCFKDYRISIDSNEDLGLDAETQEETNEAGEAKEVKEESAGEDIKMEEDKPIEEEEGLKMETEEEVEKKEVDENSAESVEKSENSDSGVEGEKCDKTEEDPIIKEEPTDVEEGNEAKVDEESLDATLAAEVPCVESIKEEPAGQGADEPMDTSQLDEDADVKAKEVCEVEEGQSASEEGAEKKSEDEKEDADSGPTTDTTHTAVSCSIDGNLELEDATSSLPSVPNKIKININKSIGLTKSGSSVIGQSLQPTLGRRYSSTDPPPPGEEPNNMKVKLIGRKLTDLPPLSKGDEVSGLCSIM